MVLLVIGRQSSQDLPTGASLMLDQCGQSKKLVDRASREAGAKPELSNRSVGSTKRRIAGRKAVSRPPSEIGSSIIGDYDFTDND